MAINISKLNKDRKLLHTISSNAAKATRRRFNTELAAKSYAQVFFKVLKEPNSDAQPLSWKKFKPDVNFKQKGDPWLPRGLKIKLKKILFLRN